MEKKNLGKNPGLWSGNIAEKKITNDLNKWRDTPWIENPILRRCQFFPV